MLSGGRRAPFFLFFGDIAVFAVSLWLTLLVRFAEVPSQKNLIDHAVPFCILFLLWLTVFYMAGLYEKRVILFKHHLPVVLFRVQLFNITLAALFFFLVPFFGITPKTVLAIYLIISLGGIFLWRLVVYPLVTRRTNRDGAAIIGVGEEVDELVREVNGNARYRLEFRIIEDPRALTGEALKQFAHQCKEKGVSLIVVDTESEAGRGLLPFIYELTFIQREFQFADVSALYEEVFDRVPLSLVKDGWLLKNLPQVSSTFYLSMKRIVDVVGGIAMGIVTLFATPLVWIAMKLEGPGPLFIEQERIGEGGMPIVAYKFRSMTQNKSASREWTVEEENENKVTRVGAFLRLTSLDEFPQFINVLRGELSLIGPRNDIEGLGMRLADAIPFYMTRYVVRPGITGWAQINQQYEQGQISPQSIEETKTRLAYDFYYIKNRSLMLDMVIALKTIKRMLFRLSA